MNKLKKKMLLPLFAITFAIVGAFATNLEEPSKNASVMGYIDAPAPCTISVQCETSGDEICTLNGQQAFGKNLGGTSCSEVLFKPRS